MPLPTILLGVVLSILYGAIFHLLRGGSARKLLIDLLLAAAGFWSGHALGAYLDWTFWSVGLLHTGLATVISLSLLLLGDLLGRIRLPGSEEN